jgi:chaperonin GroEL (HSP60 family)
MYNIHRVHLRPGEKEHKRYIHLAQPKKSAVAEHSVGIAHTEANVAVTTQLSLGNRQQHYSDNAIITAMQRLINHVPMEAVQYNAVTELYREAFSIWSE